MKRQITLMRAPLPLFAAEEEARYECAYTGNDVYAVRCSGSPIPGADLSSFSIQQAIMGERLRLRSAY